MESFFCRMFAKNRGEFVMKENNPYPHVVNGTLKVTPDIEEEIAAVDRGETVSMSEFKTMFAKWL